MTVLAMNCSKLFDRILLLESTEKIAAAVEDWVAHAWNAETIEPLGANAVDFQPPEEWGDVPDVPECDFCELTSPTCGNAAAKQDCADVVTQVLPQIETLKKQQEKLYTHGNLKPHYHDCIDKRFTGPWA